MSVQTGKEEEMTLSIVVPVYNVEPYLTKCIDSLLQQDIPSTEYEIILVDDEHTSSQWRALRRNENLPLEYYLTDRVKDEKSAVDVALTIKFYREIAAAKNEGKPIDSAIIISSDCDFWPLIELTPEVKFLVMLEYDNCSQSYYQRLHNNDVPFFYIDEYFSFGCVCVMLARGAIANPFLFEEYRGVFRDSNQKIEILINFALRAKELSGEHKALTAMKRFAGAVLKFSHGSAEKRNKACMAESLDEIIEILRDEQI